MSADNTNYSIHEDNQKIQTIGYLTADMLSRLALQHLPPGEIYMYPGVIKHIKKYHPNDWENYFQVVPNIIAQPDYIGKNPKEPDSIEFVKDGIYLLIAVKWDGDRKYFYLSSFYTLDNGQVKIQKRLKSGRIVPF